MAQIEVAPASRAARTTVAIAAGSSEIPGRIGAIPTLASIPASIRVRIARRRWRGGAVPGSVWRQMRSSTVGMLKVTPTLARSDAVVRTSTSRTTIGPRVISPNGVRDSPSATIAPRVNLNRPSAGWYGSVAVPMATCSRRHDRRASSRVRTSTILVLTRIEVPYRASHGRSEIRSKART